jgi:hypothetical protein
MERCSKVVSRQIARGAARHVAQRFCRSAGAHEEKFAELD